MRAFFDSLAPSITFSSPSSRFAAVSIIDNIEAARPYWDALQGSGAVATPYHRFEFLASWYRNVGAEQGVAPFIVVGLDRSDRPICLLPLGLQRLRTVRRVSFLGGSHANFNMGLWDRSAAATSADDLKALLDGIARSPSRPDVLTLYNQPRSWDGFQNPMMLLPHANSANCGAMMQVDSSPDELIDRTLGAGTRGRLRTKKRKLQKLAGYRYFRATEPEEIDRLLTRFLEVKAVRMAEQVLPSVYTDPGVEAFLRAACRPDSGEGPAIEVHALEGGGEVLAVFGVLASGSSMSVLFNTYTLSQNARHSPGLILILELIVACAERGFSNFDLGAGEAQYKSWFCKQRVDLFDSFLPLTQLGWLSTAGFRALSAAKREIKANPVLWSSFQALRRTWRTSGRMSPPMIAILGAFA